MNESLWCVDVEGNGASPPEIIELAMVEWSVTGAKRRQFSWLMKPTTSISNAVSRIHGITDIDVADSPSAEDIADDVLTWLNDRKIVGHNVRVEVETLRRAFPDWQPTGAIDTLVLAKRLKPGLSSYGLKALGDKFKLNKEAELRTGQHHHSALYDATLAGLLLSFLLKDLSKTEQDKALVEADFLNPSQGQLL